MGYVLVTYEDVERLFDDGRLVKDYPPSVYFAYLRAKNLGLLDLESYPTLLARHIETYYAGYFASRKEFIDFYITDLCNTQLPSAAVLDYERTWIELRNQFLFVPDDGHYDGGWYFENH